MIKTIIFDMDGVLIDSIQVHYLSWKKLFSPYGDLTWEEFVPLIGKSTPATVQTLKLKFNVSIAGKILEKEKDHIYSGLSDKMKLYPNIYQLLQYLQKKRLKLVVATSEPTEIAKKLLKMLDIINFFQSIVGRDQIQDPKPAPDLFLKAAELSNSRPTECIVIEDSIAGVMAGKNAKMKVIAVTTTTKPELLKDADIVTDDLCKTLKNTT